jgi:hypothetical protein
MTLKQTQEKPGHLRGVSPPVGGKSGASGHDGGQKKVGYPRSNSTPEGGSSGSSPEQGPVRGYKNRVSDRGISTTRRDLVNKDPRIG